MHNNIEQKDSSLQKSKSEIKRELQKLQLLGKQLVELTEKQLIDFPISNTLKDAIFAAKNMKHGALNRQLKYIGNLMPNEDEVSIRKSLNKPQQSNQGEVNYYSMLEEWRDRLLQSDQVLLDELALKFDCLERQYIRQLIRNEKKEKIQKKTSKSAKLLLKYLTDLQQGSGAV